MSCKITIVVPGHGGLLVPVARALEAQAALDVTLHGNTEKGAALRFVAQQFRGGVAPDPLAGDTPSWEDVWEKSGYL